MKLTCLLCYLAFAVCAIAAPDLRRAISELTLKDGRTLKNVTIVSYANSAVMAKWEGGRGTIPYQQFPDAWRSEIEPMRPKAPLTPAPVQPTNLVVSVSEPSSPRPADNIAPGVGSGLEKLIAQQAAEIAALRSTLEAIEKRLRGI